MLKRSISRYICLILALSFLLPGITASANLSGPNSYLLRDITDATSIGSEPHWLMPAGDVTYFFLTNSIGISELWKTDGTLHGTSLVKSGLGSGRSSDVYNRTAEPKTFAFFKNILYFPATDEDSRAVLWQTDGTENGTRMVLNTIYPIELPSSLIQVNDLLYFFSYTGGVYSTDGTPDGVQLLDVTHGFRSNMILFAGNLYYTYYDLDTYTLDRIELVAPAPYPSVSLEFPKTHDWFPYDNSVYKPQDLWVYNNNLYFAAREDVSGVPDAYGYELWKMSETGEATLVSDINVSGDSNPSGFAIYNDFLYFSADDGQGRKLWRTNGNANGTIEVQDLHAGAGSYLEYQFLDVIGAVEGQAGKLYFATFSDEGNSMWATDGTTAGTVWLSSSADRYSFFGAVLGSQYYYTTEEPVHGMEVWRTDGTTQGTLLYEDFRIGAIGSYPAAMTVCGVRICFTADDGEYGKELWSIDGDPTQTMLLGDLNRARPGSTPWDFTPAGDLVFFIASDRISATNLWRTDGTFGGTIALNNNPSVSFPPYSQFIPDPLVSVGSSVYLVGSDPNHGKELWWSDGTLSGTKIVKDIYPGHEDSAPKLLTAVGDRIYFLANTPQSGRELWVSDGSEAGTHLVKDIIPNGTDSLNYRSFAVLGEKLIFTIEEADWPNPAQLWVTDGTQAGTKLFASFPRVFFMVEAGGNIFFTGRATTDNLEAIYETDGTSAGTHLFAPLNFLLDSHASGMYSAGDRVFILEQYEVDFYNLYTFVPNGNSNNFIHTLSDTNTSGTTFPRCVGFNGKLGCMMQDYDWHTSTYGDMNLWMSDGTSAGTVHITGDFSWPEQMVGKGMELVFSAETPSEGRQIWETDGTTGGTQQISHFNQIMCGLDLDRPVANSLVYWGGQYLLPLDDEGNDLSYDCELWALDMRLPQVYLPLITR